MGLTINDLPLSLPFRVYDIEKGQCIFSLLEDAESGDVPPDIAFLPVLGLRAVDNVLYIDVRW